jgi:L-threonylcarbamoyladenylate synthase
MRKFGHVPITANDESTTTLRLGAADPAAIATAVVWLRRGLPVVFPTDTVYGVGVLPFDAVAIDRLYAAKGRPAEKGIPVLLADAADVGQVAGNVGPGARALMARFWPGPLTLVVPRRPELPANLSPDDTVAVRVPDHAVARALIRAAGGAVAATSANVSGQPPARSADEALASLGGRVAVVLDDGPSPGGLASTVVDCTVEPPVVLRAGPLSATELGVGAS